MSPKSAVEIADQKSRLRAILFAFATVVFIGVQILTHPAFNTAAYTHGWRSYAWAFNAALLLLCLGSGGGVLNPIQIRALINDEVAQLHNRRACTVGFWMSMVTALVTYCIPSMQSFTGHQVAYLVVTIGASSALLTFAWLEYRAHADA
jgi:hypothetical protein